MSCDTSRPLQEDESLLFFPGKNTANEKPRTLCLCIPLNFLFPSVKEFFPCYAGTYMWLTVVADP